MDNSVSTNGNHPFPPEGLKDKPKIANGKWPSDSRNQWAKGPDLITGIAPILTPLYNQRSFIVLVPVFQGRYAGNFFKGGPKGFGIRITH